MKSTKTKKGPIKKNTVAKKSTATTKKTTTAKKPTTTTATSSSRKVVAKKPMTVAAKKAYVKKSNASEVDRILATIGKPAKKSTLSPAEKAKRKASASAFVNANKRR